MMKQIKDQDGAIIVEASLALPFFIFTMYTVLMIAQIAYTQARIAVALDSATKQMAEYVNVYFVAGLDDVFTGQGGMSSDLANEVGSFLQELGDQVGTVSSELGQYVSDTGQSLSGDSLTALIQDGIGMAVAEQMMRNNLRDGPTDNADAFLKRNHVISLDMLGSKFLEAGADSTGKDIFMRVNYEIEVVRLLGLEYSFHLSHCAYAQAWAGE